MKFPQLDSLDLAYETGLHIGDGCLSHYLPHHYRYVLSGNRKSEREYYSQYLVPMLEGLYGLRPRLYEHRNSIYLTITSKALVLFKSHQVGLPIGGKDELKHLPQAILRHGPQNVASLLSGLYDADGSVKVRKTSSGNYPRISFAQKSKGIVEDVKRLLSETFQVTSTMYRNDYFDVRVEKVETRWFLDVNGVVNFRRFMEKVGSRHPVIIKRMLALSHVAG